MTEAYRVHTYAAARRPRPRLRRNPAPVDVQRVPEGLWRDALALAGGDVRRLVVKSATEVLVVNRPRQPR